MYVAADECVDLCNSVFDDDEWMKGYRRSSISLDAEADVEMM